jgi:hypothetical protein
VFPVDEEKREGVNRNKSVKGEKEELIAYCGLYCGDCSGYKGTIANLTRDLHNELRRERFADLAAALSQIPFFKALLASSSVSSRPVMATLT